MMMKVTAILSEDAAADRNAYMLFTFENGIVKKQMLSDAVNNGDGTYTFTCPVSPLRVEEEIHMQLHYTDDITGVPMTYSVKRYFDTLLANESVYDAKTMRLVKSILNYAGALQKYEGYADDCLANRDLSADAAENVELSDIYDAVIVNSGSNVRAKSASLDVASLVTMNVNFALSEGIDLSQYRVTLDGKTVAAKKSGTTCMISLKGISPTGFDDMHVFRIQSLHDPADYSEITFSVYSYAKKLMQTSSDSTLGALAQAIANYGEAAIAYQE
jgi:hypothetical protein